MIDILLSTYNGEKYLQEQLDSIISQSFGDWRLLIRDDASKDSTNDIITRYCSLYPTKIRCVGDCFGNLGVIRSFELLMKESDADYIMFCDQDDVWLPNKIHLTFERMKQLGKQYGNNVPILVHTNLFVVDEDKNIVSDSFWDYAAMKPELLDGNIHFLAICNCVTGCTLMINKRAKEVSLPFVSPVEMHDAWIAIHVKKCGVVDYIEQSTIQYRQHTSNICGAKPASSSIKYKLQNLNIVFRENKQKYLYYHPFVYKSVFHYLYYKVIYFIFVRFF